MGRERRHGRRAADRRSTGLKLAVGAGLGVVVVSGSAFWLAHRAGQARDTVALLKADGAQLQRQVQAGDLDGAATTLRALRLHADHARAQTSDPVWRAAALVPGVGRDPAAIRTVTTAVADIADAAAPLESALPQLAPGGKPFAGGKIDLAGLQAVADAMPGLAAAVASGDQAVQAIDVQGLRPEVAGGVVTVQRLLAGARGPMADAVPALQLLPPMLGADRPKTWMVLLQQGAEARGTGGLVGAYAVLRTDQGRIRLVKAAPRGELQQGAIPADGVPEDVRDLWGPDLVEWAGLNLSPNFPWTGRLVADGWKADGLTPALDYVVGLDQGVVSAMLAGTGAVQVRDQTVDAGNAVPFLTAQVYDRYRDPHDVDRVTAELVGLVFARFASGQVNVSDLVRAMVAPVEERRLQLWSADLEEQRRLSTLAVSGIIPDTPGPFAMAVVNNGGGNKLDAYLKVHTTYEPGPCSQGVRVGRIKVDLTNDAPTSGLPDYVDVRSDVKAVGLRALGLSRMPRRGSNRVILDVYGPVGGQAPAVALDGTIVPVTTGSDRGHPVWRVVVPMDPQQSRSVEVVVTQLVGLGAEPRTPTVVLQPMVQPATASVGELPPCRNSFNP